MRMAEKRQQRLERNRLIACFALGSACGAFLTIVVLSLVSHI